jgi:hypothetical protein
MNAMPPKLAAKIARDRAARIQVREAARHCVVQEMVVLHRRHRDVNLDLWGFKEDRWA